MTCAEPGHRHIGRRRRERLGLDVSPIQKGADIVVPEGDYANFVAKAPGDGTAVDASGITITLKNLSISTMPGTARIEVRETATLDTGKWPDSPGFVTLPITKFPAPVIPVQAVCDFRAEQLEVSAGDAVRLTWNGPSTLEYTVLHGGGATPAEGQADTGKFHEWKGTVSRDTTFQLSYVTGGTTHYLTTVVTVANPQFTGLKVRGATELESVTANGDLTANGNVTAVSGDKIFRIRELRGPYGEQLTVNSTIDVLVGNSVTVTDGLTVGGLTVNGDLTANGNVTAVSGDKVFRIRDLRGPYGETLSVNSSTHFLSGNDVTIEGGLTRGGKSVVCEGDMHHLRHYRGDGKGDNWYVNYIGDSIYLSSSAGASEFYFD
ncbi:hypothetical protein [Streptomyces thioluteus]|uniref:hypothetical protein n=1 Tax=Streptomyces thioluteus TaxID=66431 RepID=UPI0031F0826C